MVVGYAHRIKDCEHENSFQEGGVGRCPHFRKCGMAEPEVFWHNISYSINIVLVNMYCFEIS